MQDQFPVLKQGKRGHKGAAEIKHYGPTATSTPLHQSGRGGRRWCREEGAFSSHCSSLLVIDNKLHLSPYGVSLLPVMAIYG